MATLTVEVPESIAAALSDLEFDEHTFEPHLRDALSRIGCQVEEIAGTCEDPNPDVIRELAARLANCADALEDALPGHGCIAVLRRGMGLSVRELAERVGVPVATLKIWERGGLYGDEKDPAAAEIAALFGVTVGHLLDRPVA